MRSVQEIWPALHVSAKALLHAAACVCDFSDDDHCQIIASFLDKRGVKTHHRPIQINENGIIYAVYHNGSRYDVYVTGEPEKILQRCIMSENEREKSLLESRRLAGANAATLSIAHGTMGVAPTKMRDITGLTFCGHISVI